jgi:hypothetical protein
MQNFFYKLVFFLAVFSLSSIALVAQPIKCPFCKGNGKATSYGSCTNCEDWNSEYKKKVACHVCKDERYIYQLRECSNCKKGYIPLDKSPWSCIENFNNAQGFYHLFDRDDFRFEKVDVEVSGKRTIFMYYKDGRAVWAYYQDYSPIMYGKWECKSDRSFLIKWSDGRIIKYGVK